MGVEGRGKGSVAEIASEEMKTRMEEDEKAMRKRMNRTLLEGLAS